MRVARAGKGKELLSIGWVRFFIDSSGCRKRYKYYAIFQKRGVLCYNTSSMILVTGGTGFIGQALVRQLVAAGKSVRLLLRPSPTSPRLPRGVAVEVAVSSLKDERGLRSALKGVDVVFHLAGAERIGSRSNLEGVDIDGSRSLASVIRQAGVERVFFISHLGADRSSAFP